MQRPYRLQTAIDQVVALLKKNYHSERIILFGSLAYGEPTKENDVDLLIVKDTDQPFHRRWAEVSQLVQPCCEGY